MKPYTCFRGGIGGTARRKSTAKQALMHHVEESASDDSTQPNKTPTPAGSESPTPTSLSAFAKVKTQILGNSPKYAKNTHPNLLLLMNTWSETKFSFRPLVLLLKCSGHSVRTAWNNTFRLGLKTEHVGESNKRKGKYTNREETVRYRLRHYFAGRRKTKAHTM
jgi:hypothetical protein